MKTVASSAAKDFSACLRQGEWYINVPFPKHHSFISNVDIWGRLMLKSMPENQGLSETQADILLAIWKLRGIGINRVDEFKVKAEVIEAIKEEDVNSGLQMLQAQGFIEAQNSDGRKSFALTPLGVAILRKTEEDRLQELK
jgi:hypothetical protein